MSALFGALGSLAESYGLARRSLEESNLRQVELRTQQQRLAMEQQEFAAWQKQQQNQLVDYKLPGYVKDGQYIKPLWSPYEGKIRLISTPVSTTPTDAAKQIIQNADPRDQQHLSNYIQASNANHPEDLQGNVDLLQKEAMRMEDERDKEKAAQDKADAAEAKYQKHFGQLGARQAQVRKEARATRLQLSRDLSRLSIAATSSQYLYQRMIADARKADDDELTGKGNAGSYDMDLLQNHMNLINAARSYIGQGGTAGAGRSMAMLQSHEEARSLWENANVWLNKKYVGSGLSHQQRANFVDLAGEVARETQALYESQLASMRAGMAQIGEQEQQQEQDLQQQQQQEEWDLRDEQGNPVSPP